MLQIRLMGSTLAAYQTYCSRWRKSRVNRTMRKAAGVVVSGMLVAALLEGTAVAAPSGTATLAGSVPSWATASHFKSPTSTSDNVGFRVYLGWSDPAGAAALASAVSNPSSASYGKYLTPAQFRQQFAPGEVRLLFNTSPYPCLFIAEREGLFAAHRQRRRTAGLGLAFGPAVRR